MLNTKRCPVIYIYYNNISEQMQQRQSIPQAIHSNPRVSFQFGNQPPIRNSTLTAGTQPVYSEFQNGNRFVPAARQITFGHEMTNTQRSQAMRFTFNQQPEQPLSSQIMPRSQFIQSSSMEQIPLLHSKSKQPTISKTQSIQQVKAPEKTTKNSFWCCF